MTTKSTSISEVTDRHLECRFPLRHRWSYVEDDNGIGRKYPASKTVVRIANRCDRCRTWRYEAWNILTGERLFAYYYYPDGYQVTDGEMVQADVRKEWADRHRNGKS